MIGSRSSTWRLLVLVTLIWGTACIPEQVCAAGLLSSLRKDVRSSGSGSSSGSSSDDDDDGHYGGHHHHDDCDDHHNGFFSELFGEMFFWTITSPFWGPVISLEDPYEPGGSFAKFPYADCAEGSMLFSPVFCDCRASLIGDAESPVHMPDCIGHQRTKTFSGRFTAEWAEQPSDLSRIGGRLQLITASRFGLDAQIDWLREPATGPIQDELRLGDCNVVYRFAQNERAQFYTGVGFNWLDDPIDTNFGFNFTYGADFFPAKPWVLSSSFDWGKLGNAGLFRFRTTAGVMVDRVEVFAGYEYLDIGSTQINTYVTGVRLWF